MRRKIKKQYKQTDTIMTEFTFANLLRFALITLLSISALALAISEPNGCYTIERWLLVFAASKFGAMACFCLVYLLYKGLSLEAEEECEYDGEKE